MAPIFENTDLLAHTCGLLDAADIARLCQSCRFVPEHIRDVKTIKFLSTMRSDAVLGNLSTIERLALVESLRECSTCIAFKVFSCDLLEASLPALKRFAALMKRHRSFSVSIEAHCGLEAPRDAGYIFARERGRNVKIALHACGVEPERLEVISYGNRRPLVWAFGNPSDAKDAGSANRRVELYVRCGDAFEAPRRRPPSEIPLPPGVVFPGEFGHEPITPDGMRMHQDIALARASEAGGTMEGEFTAMTMRGCPIVFPTALLRQLSVGPAGGEDDDDDSDEDEEGEGEWEEWAEDDEEEEEGVPFLDGDSEDDDGDGA